MPPLSRLVRTQLIVVLLIGLVASVYGGIRYARLDQAAGVGVYHVTVRMPDSGGLFEQAQVTYRGVEIGRVQKMSIVPGGIDVTLALDSSEAKVPASAVAVVADRSAIGEQFLDLQPPSDAGPYLRDGSVIDENRLPPRLDEVVRSAIDLTDTIPVDALRRTVTELGAAFNGRGDDMSRLVDSLDRLSKEGVESLDETIGLITSADSVLATQNEQSDEILRWSKNLDAVTATLASSDPADPHRRSARCVGALPSPRRDRRRGHRTDRPARRDGPRDRSGVLCRRADVLDALGTVGGQPYGGLARRFDPIRNRARNGESAVVHARLREHREDDRRDQAQEPGFRPALRRLSVQHRCALHGADRQPDGGPRREQRCTRRSRLRATVGSHGQEGPGQVEPQPPRHSARATHGRATAIVMGGRGFRLAPL